MKSGDLLWMVWSLVMVVVAITPFWYFASAWDDMTEAKASGLGLVVTTIASGIFAIVLKTIRSRRKSIVSAIINASDDSTEGR